ncbi:MAG: hypothetical protein QNJ04_09200 [Desulfobacterales bacterium]|nr:hypothetical protein [Desulfobacterales bacterium]
MKRWKMVVALTVVLILGIMIGVVGTGVVIKHGLAFGHRGSEERKAFIMKRLERRLDLTGAQKERVASIVDRRHAKAREQFRRHRQALHAFMQESFAEIRKELLPEQQVKLDAFQTELEERFRKRGRHFHPPHKP